jgi:hypothetical protein
VSGTQLAAWRGLGVGPGAVLLTALHPAPIQELLVRDLQALSELTALERDRLGHADRLRPSEQDGKELCEVVACSTASDSELRSYMSDPELTHENRDRKFRERFGSDVAVSLGPLLVDGNTAVLYWFRSRGFLTGVSGVILLRKGENGWKVLQIKETVYS